MKVTLGRLSGIFRLLSTASAVEQSRQCVGELKLEIDLTDLEVVILAGGVWL